MATFGAGLPWLDMVVAVVAELVVAVRLVAGFDLMVASVVVRLVAGFDLMVASVVVRLVAGFDLMVASVVVRPVAGFDLMVASVAGLLAVEVKMLAYFQILA